MVYQTPPRARIGARLPLAPGSRIGSHVVLSLIGEGGMGEVYRARNTTLDRDVAIKRLPDAVASDRERLARFEREAKALAALNHPNVAQIYAVESGTIVMELVPGAPLGGPLPLETALAYAQQIAAALEAAHERGLIHRDLKPGNITITPDGVVKVLDFGLAARDEARAEADPSQSPTLTAPISAGLILGTAAYMAPEQAAGKPVDKRADIFAFGVVLWEMLTGRRLFEGETVSHVLAAVLTQEPDLSAVPPPVRHLLSRCLEKDPRKRLRDIGDAMSLVLPADGPGAVAPVPSQRWLPLAGWLTAAGVAVLAMMAWPRPGGDAGHDAPAARFSIARGLDLYAQVASSFAVSPDGLRLAYIDQADDGRFGVFLRRLDTGEVQELPGSVRMFGSRPHSLTWSPDGRSLVRGLQASVVAVEVATGASRPLCECLATGAAWNRIDEILLGGFGLGVGIRRVSPGGSAPVAVTTPDITSGEQDRWPVFLPDGQRFLFTRTTNGVDAAYLGSLEGTAPRKIGDGSPRALVSLAGGRHYLLGIDGSGASAWPFDVETASVTGPATTIVAGAAAVSATGSGVMAASAPGQRPLTIPTWYDRRGAVVGTIGSPGTYESVALSSDRRMLALAEGPPGRNDFWTIDATTGIKTRLTFHEGNDSTPAWSPDGRRLVYTSVRGWARLYQRLADGTGGEIPFLDLERDAYANDWSPDGRWVLYTLRGAASMADNDLFAVPITNGEAGTPVPYLAGPGRQQQARFSPDGRFIVYG